MCRGLRDRRERLVACSCGDCRGRHRIICMFDQADEVGLDGDSVAAAVRSLSVADLGPFLRALPDVSELDDFCLVEVMKGWERVSRGAAAGVLAAVAELARRRPDARRGWVRDAEPEHTALGNPVLAPEDDLSSSLSRCAAAEVAVDAA